MGILIRILAEMRTERAAKRRYASADSASLAMRILAIISVTIGIYATLGARALGASSGEVVTAKPPGSDSIEALST